MKKLLAVIIVFSMIAFSSGAYAGNTDRSGSAGAPQLLINPWARSSGFAGANMAGVRGLEAQFLNVAGIAFTRKTEVIFSRTSWISGADININAFGLTQRVSETGVLGLGVMTMSFGEIMKTTVDFPEGGLGNFSPSFSNLALSYGKEFSRSIYGGLTAKIISEGIQDVKAYNIAFDAGIQYVTGINKRHKDNLRFGISLKNVGPAMSYSGDGLSLKEAISENEVSLTISQRSAGFEMPSLLNIGASFDVYAGGDDSLGIAPMHKIIFAASFTSNSFTNDQYFMGLEYSYNSMLMLRGGFVHEENIFSSSDRVTFLTGPTAGFTFEVPLSAKGRDGVTLGIDYSYRATNPFTGVHSIGARINI